MLILKLKDTWYHVEFHTGILMGFFLNEISDFTVKKSLQVYSVFKQYGLQNSLCDILQKFDVLDILAFATWQADPDVWRLVLKRRLLSLLHSMRYG